MKKTLIAMAALIFITLSVGCEKEKPLAEITIKDGVTEILFDVEDTTPKTLSFNSTDAWNLSLEDGSWLIVNPIGGEKGDYTLTLSLKGNKTSRVERTDKVTITAGEISKSVTVKQLATIPLEKIDILAIQRKVKPGGIIRLTAVNAANQAVLEGVTWTSSQPAFATVDAEGKVTAIAVGTTTIEAKCKNVTGVLDIEVTKDFFTDGIGKTYTFEDLSKLSTSGVIYKNNVATVTNTLTISPFDIITFGNATKVILGNKVQLRIEGTADFNGDDKVSIETEEGAAKNAQLYFTNDYYGGGKITGVEFKAVYIRYFGVEPLTIENCTFHKITDKFAAVNLGAKALATINNCKFIENSYPAIGGYANSASPVVFTNNMLDKNSKTARNRPQINLTVGGNKEIVVKGNTVIGPFENTPNGGIAIGNMLGIPGSNKVLIEGNKVSGCRFGIYVLGAMNVVIKDNVLEDNKFDANPMTGGSGVSITSPNDKTIVTMTGNTISGHLWGVTNICPKEGTGAQLNLGNIAEGDQHNPGNNTFKNNGNNGVLYDLYNNSGATVYAQGNYWNVEVQDEKSIEAVIFHKHDDPKLGEVIFMPAGK